MDWPALLLRALLIFTLRMLDMTLYTLRLSTVVRGRRGAAWGIGLLQSLAYLMTVRSVILDSQSPLILIAYAVGFATGLVVGMIIEARFLNGFVHLRIVSPACGPKMVDCLRASGFAVTEVPAQGRSGCVSMLNCFILRREISEVTKLAAAVDPRAFITAGSVRLIWHGFWHAASH